jgi:hypothetical protein
MKLHTIQYISNHVTGDRITLGVLGLDVDNRCAIVRRVGSSVTGFELVDQLPATISQFWKLLTKTVENTGKDVPTQEWVAGIEGLFFDKGMSFVIGQTVSLSGESLEEALEEYVGMMQRPGLWSSAEERHFPAAQRAVREAQVGYGIPEADQ